MKFPYSIKELEKLYQDGYLAKQKHPKYDIWIYNYSQKCQFEQLWNPITLMCRGLVLDSDYNVLARPIPKFFNIEEHKPEEIPNESYEILEKKDGSYISVFWVNGEMIVSSRGSFTSDHAVKAREIIEKKYKKIIDSYKLDELNLVFELVAKFNKIVVDYGDTEDLFLITAIANDTRDEVPYEVLQDFGFPIVKRYKNLKISELKELNSDNEEGFVVKFKSGMRIKIKFEDYVRLHRIVTNVSTKTIWEHLKDDEPLDDLLDNVPDEFFKWVKFTIKKFENQYKEIEEYCKENFKILETRKECALYYQTKKYPAVLFKMMEDKPYDQIIWKIIKPKYEKPFKIEE